MTSTAIVAYLALFATVGFVFVLACLTLGRVMRAHAPTAQKLEAYECGEPAVGSGMVQFDLRFYVVALLFLIFEVEVAFFFPPATVFGWSIAALDPARAPTIGAENPLDATATPASTQQAASWANTLAPAAMLDLGVFFAVLLVGFAYLWRRGDLDWVRGTRHPNVPAKTDTPADWRRG